MFYRNAVPLSAPVFQPRVEDPRKALFGERLLFFRIELGALHGEPRALNALDLLRQRRLDGLGSIGESPLRHEFVIIPQSLLCRRCRTFRAPAERLYRWAAL